MAKDAAKKTSTKVSKVLIQENAYQFLKDYINNPSPVGFESSGQKIWLNYLKKYVDTTFTDPYGTAVGVINPEHPFKVVIEAHADEISWFVNYITEQGLIHLKRNGGVDHQIAPSMRVWIHGKKGPVKAVFGWPAIHTRMGNAEQKEPQPKVETLTLDCGARSKKDVEALGIHIGSVVTYTDGFDELAHDFIIGRAFDNRIGGFMIAGRPLVAPARRRGLRCLQATGSPRNTHRVRHCSWFPVQRGGDRRDSPMSIPPAR